MEYRPYGKTGEEVSILSMGGMRFAQPDEIDKMAEIPLYMYDHGVNCLRVDAQQPTQLAEAMRQMNGLDLAQMGRISRHRTQEFDWSRIADRYLTFFDRVIEQHPDAGA